MVEKLQIQIDLEGAEQVQTQLAGIGDAGQKAFADISKAAGQANTAISFEEATKSIAALGATSKQAFEAAAAAAQKFGASASQIAQVETVIRSLATRARDSSTSFQVLAQNYDKARSSITGAGLATAAQGLSTITKEAAATTGGLGGLTRAVQDLR